MKRFLYVSATFGVLFLGLAAWAEDQVFVRGKEKAVKGVISKESAKGIEFKDGTKFVAETVDDVIYDVTPLTVLTTAYRPAFTVEKESLEPGIDAKKRRAKIDESLKKYQDASTKANEALAKRHCDYKVAVLTARLAAEDSAAPDAAIDAFKNFKSKHADSWQIGTCLQQLGRLQLEARDFAGAKATYAELSEANVPDDVKQEAQLQVIQVDIRDGKAAAAKSALDAFFKTVPPNSKHAVKGRVVQGELMVAAKEFDGALKILTQAAKETSDKDLKALIYNAKGVCLVEKGDHKAARWEFLWVDVVYNQSKNEHAKALYYLQKIFDELGEPERAQECREMLLNDRDFTGNEWRARAQKEVK